MFVVDGSVLCYRNKEANLASATGDAERSSRDKDPDLYVDASQYTQSVKNGISDQGLRIELGLTSTSTETLDE